MRSSCSLSFLLLLAAAEQAAARSPSFGLGVPAFVLRGGESSAATDGETSTAAEDGAVSLDDKVRSAMEKLGISAGIADGAECKDGVCAIPDGTDDAPTATTTGDANVDPHQLAETIAEEMGVDKALAMAAIGATCAFGPNNERLYNGKAARDIIQHELDLIASIPEDSEDVQRLVKGGFDPFLCRRALAFAEGNMDDARAILMADKLDQEEEEAALQKASEEEKTDDESLSSARPAQEEERMHRSPESDIVEVKADFDPTKLPLSPSAEPTQPKSQGPPGDMPTPAAKESVVFEATTAQLQELVLESPVPVLLDVYADWCGPCKALTPALEEMAIKGGGAFRLVKVNTDANKPASAALEVTALPTVFAIRDGKVVHMFQGIPKSDEMIKNFMLGLFNLQPFKPAITPEQSAKYEELTEKLIKTASSASFPFSARERLNERVTMRLNELVTSDSVEDVEGAARLMRTMFNNVIRHPLDEKYRSINLDNKVVASKIGTSSACIAIIKSVGFVKSGSMMIVGKDQKVANVAPLMIARDAIDNWIQKNQREMVAAARRRKDEIDRVKVQADLAAKAQEEALEEEEEEESDPTICKLKVRLDGKKKVHEMKFGQDDPISAVLDALEIDDGSQDVQITCVAKRLVLKSSDEGAMRKSLRELKLTPSSAIVVKVGSGSAADDAASSLKERAAKKALKKGSHTMQSVGIYSKDDNNKAELIDGGGGVLYEHDVTDDEDEAAEPAEEAGGAAGGSGSTTGGEDSETMDDENEEKDH